MWEYQQLRVLAQPCDARWRSPRDLRSYFACTGCSSARDSTVVGEKRRSPMSEVAAPYGSKTQRPPDVSDVHVVWITAGLGCDGDSVSITAATQPSLEDVVLGAIPGLPRVHLHNPVLAYEVGDDFMRYYYAA